MIRYKINHRPGVTLVELLTVLGIVSLLALLVLPSVKTMMTDRKSTNAATMVRNFLESARARAVGSGLPVAVVFERLSSQPADTNFDGVINELDLVPNNRLVSATATDPLTAGAPVDTNFLPYNASIRMSIAEQPLPVTDEMLASTPVIMIARPIGPPVRTVPAALVRVGMEYFVAPGLASGSVFSHFLVAGNEISFNQSNSRHMIVRTEIEPAGAFVNVWFSVVSSTATDATLEQAIPSNGAPSTTTTNFTIFPKPRPVNGPAVQLPKGTCVDLSLSGFSSSGNILSRDARMRFSSAWVYAIASAPNASELRPIYIVFTPDGGLSRVYANAAGGSTLIPIETADDFFLHIGKIEQVTVPVFDNTISQNLTDPSTFVVRLSPKSGAISVAPATQGIPAFADVGSVLELTRQGTYGSPLTGQ